MRVRKVPATTVWLDHAKPFIRYFPAILLGVLFLFPYLWLILTSFKTRVQAQHWPPVWYFAPILDNYYQAFVTGPFLPNLMNSAFVAFGSTVVAVSLALPCAYVLSQLRIPGERHYLFYLLSTRMIPPVSLAIPLYSIYNNFGLRDTLPGLAIAHATFNIPFAVLMLKGFYDAIPKDLIHAARLDGIGHWIILTRITRVFVKPGVAATAVFCFIFSWNDFFFAKVLVDQHGTLPIAILGLDTVHGTKWGQLAAVCSVITFPLIIFAWSVQRYILRGLTYGLVK